MLRTLMGKLTLGVALFLVLLALVTASTISVTLTNAALSNHLIEDILSFVHHSDLFDLHTARALAEAEAFVRTQESGDAEEAREQLTAAHTQLTALEALVVHDDLIESEQTARSTLLQRQQAFLATSEQRILTVFQAIAANDQEAVIETLEEIEETEGQFAQLEADTTVLLDQEVARATDTITQQNQQGLIVTPIGFGLLGLSALLTLWLLQRFIVRPIRGLSTAAEVVASGNFTEAVQVTSTDEIGELQAGFNKMVRTLMPNAPR